jgi:hypothetical protein
MTSRGKPFRVRRPTYAAGERWSKWEAPLRQQPWWQYKAGLVGFCLVYASLGGLLAVLVGR